VRSALGDVVASAYLHGAVCFDNPPGWVLDLDFHVLLHRPLADDELAAVRALHLRLAPLDLDGYYLQLDDARRATPPRSQLKVFPRNVRELFDGPVDHAWALHRAHAHAGRVHVLDGLHPREVVPVPTWDELAQALASEAGFVLAHPEHPEYGVLQACRITYSRRTRDVVLSKWDAARWAMDELPDLRPPIEAAVRAYTDALEDGDAELLHGAWPEVVALLEPTP